MNAATAAIASVVLACTLGLTGATSSAPRGQSPAPVTRAIAVADLAPVLFEVAGDSITTLEYLGQPRGELSWINWAVTPRVVYAGGCAESGLQTWEMADCFAPVPGAEVLVIVAGTNDVRNDAYPVVSMLYFDALAEESGLAAGQVVVSAVAPADEFPSQAAAFNAVLAQHVAERGWVLVDPWAAVRTPDGGWVAGSTYDGIHPTGATQSVTGALLRSAIWRAARLGGVS